MLILDKKNRSWFIITLVAIGLAGVIRWRVGATGGDVSAGSLVGLWFGIAATLLMLFATLLWVNRKFASKGWWLFRREIWLRGHLWLGTLGVILVFFHAGFHLGGTLTKTLWVLTLATTLTGWFGVLMQQFIPWLMSVHEDEIPVQQMEHICDEMQREADNRIEVCCGWETLDDAIDTVLDGGEFEPSDDIKRTVARFYAADIRPYLQIKGGRSPLTNPRVAAAAFERMRRMQLSQALREAVDLLEQLCDQRRKLATQTRLHRWLHGWLVLHIPLAFALMLLSIVHAVAAVLY